MNKRLVAGFTLAEVLLGLVISSWALVLLASGLHQPNHQRTVQQTTQKNYVSQLEQLLQSDVWQFAVKEVEPNKLILTATAPKSNQRQVYELHRRRDQLVLTQAKRGHIVVAYDVTNVRFAYRKHVLTIRLTINNQKFVINQVLPKERRA